MRWFLLIAIFAGSACGTTGPSRTTGLTGVVMRGPTTPVCRVDVPCEAPFSAGFTVQIAGRVVGQFRSDASGQFAVSLDPGTYTIVPDSDAPLLAPMSQTKIVTVGNDGLTTVRLVFN